MFVFEGLVTLCRQRAKSWVFKLSCIVTPLYSLEIMSFTLYLSLYKAGVLTQLRYTKEEFKKLRYTTTFPCNPGTVCVRRLGDAMQRAKNWVFN